MKVIFLNVEENKEPQVMEINDKIDTYYKLINCNTIDIVMRKIGKRYFRIICDDEGLLKGMPKISAIDDYGEIQLFGNLIICSEIITEDGELTGLTDEETIYLSRYITKMSTRNFLKGYHMITQCSY